MRILLFIIFYAYASYSLQVIADKTGIENGWLAWIPIVNLYLMCRIADKPTWWILLAFIPLVNLIILILIWMAIAEAVNKPAWLGILMIIPLANLISLGYLAFSD